MANSEQNSTKEGSLWERLYQIKHDDPHLNENTWFIAQPCKHYRLFGQEILITQPSSTFWVYLLGILTTALGCYLLVEHEGQISRGLWGVSLILWGIGALLAGTSYQAFGYQIKCDGRPEVVWTSWWEVIYLIFQQVSVSVMLVAVAYSCLPDGGQKFAIIAATVVSILYITMVFYGALKPIKSLITFELMVHICTPFIVFMLLLNTWRYWQFSSTLDLALIGNWLGLIATMVLYEKYMSLGVSEKLWAKGRWFSENDVLHVALIAWVFYLSVVLEPLIVNITAYQ